MIRVVAALALSLLVFGCSPSAPDLAAVPAGAWGGDHLLLVVHAGGARLELDCAQGTVDEALALDARGRFDARGVFIREHGGPAREGESPDVHPARYTGSTDGRTLLLTITLLDAALPAASYRLARDQAPRLVKCL